MTTNRLVGALIGAAMLLFSDGGLAQEFEFDVNHTHILFANSHFGFSYVHGEFTAFEGTASFDPENIEAAFFDVTINVSSIETGYALRNEHMVSADWFDAEQFPTMHFVTTSVERTGETTARMAGDFTLKGVTRSVTLEVELTGEGHHPFHSEVQIFGFHATGTFNRSDFGFEYGIPYMGDEVIVTIETELQREVE